MKRVYNREPKEEHYGCLVDLLGRAGLLEEAKSINETLPLQWQGELWGSLLAACKTHRLVDLAEALLQKLA